MNRTGFIACIVTAGLGLAGLCAVAGCNRSVYHRVRDDLPAGERERLRLRVREARDSAEKVVRQLEQRPLDPAAVSRVEALAWDFSRRVRSVEDVLNRSGVTDEDAQGVREALQQAEGALHSAAEGVDGRGPTHAWGAAAVRLRAAIARADRYLSAGESARP